MWERKRSVRGLFWCEAHELIAAAISEDAILQNWIEAALKATVNVDSFLMIPEYPEANSVLTLEDGREQHVAFIDFRDHSYRALGLARRHQPLILVASAEQASVARNKANDA